MISFKGALSALFVCTLLGGPAQGQTHKIKFASLAPEGSNWISTIRAIDADLRTATNGEVGFKIYAGGVQGDESAMLRKFRVGQIHAGIFGGQAASKAFADLLALEMPFLFNGYDEVNYVLDKMTPYYQEGYLERGYIHLGWADIGFVNILSNAPVKKADDIKGLKVWRLEGEPITDVLFKHLGVTSVPLTIPDVLLGLQTNLVDVVYASPAAAIVLQWFTKAKYVTQLPINYTLGVFLMDKRAFAKLKPEYQEALRTISAKHFATQMANNRVDNDKALQVMQDQGLELVQPDEAGVATFQDLVRQAAPELVGKAFSQASQDLLEQHLQTYRQKGANGP